MERTEAGWSRSGEPTPRWRSLLDRALLGGRTEASAAVDPYGYAAPAPRHEGRADDAYGPYDDRRYDDGRYDDGRYDDGRYDDGRYDGRRAAPQPIEWQPVQAADPFDRLAAVLRADLGGPRVVAFANPKGGVHKTTATVLAAATIGSVRGRGVVAWDDNELRGTLGLRAGSARHARTIRHLIADLAEVEISGGLALRDRIDDYLRHAADGSYDVLAGEENPRFAQRLDPYTVRRVVELLCRTHDVVCVDTGNNVESANWQTVLQMADQLVVTTVPREDAAFTADWMLDLLVDAGMGRLVADAMTLLSCASPGPSPLVDDLAAHFRSRTRDVVVVPYDPILETGSSIEYDMLAPPTRRAWLNATATMLEPFAR